MLLTARGRLTNAPSLLLPGGGSIAATETGGSGTAGAPSAAGGGSAAGDAAAAGAFSRREAAAEKGTREATMAAAGIFLRALRAVPVPLAV
jgi:hypothetical protein